VSLVYVYAVTPADGEAARSDLRGLEEAPVRELREGPIAAFVSDVPEGEFGEGPLNENLRDLPWLTPRAVRHQAVNAALAGHFDSLAPLPFGTVFRGDDSVRRMLRERADELAARLASLRGKAEWIAAVRRDGAAAVAALESASDALRALRDEIGAAAPGRAYLLSRRLDEVRRQEIRTVDAAAAGAAAEVLTGAGGRLYREPVIEDAPGGMVVRFSVLAARDGAAPLDRAAALFDVEWRDRGYALELTGPWPAYRFAGAGIEEHPA